MQLATEMLRLFDPTLDQQTAPPEESLNLIPIYRNPKIQGGILPGTSVLFEFALNRNSISVTYSKVKSCLFAFGYHSRYPKANLANSEI